MDRGGGEGGMLHAEIEVLVADFLILRSSWLAGHDSDNDPEVGTPLNSAPSIKVRTTLDLPHDCTCHSCLVLCWLWGLLFYADGIIAGQSASWKPMRRETMPLR